MGRWVLSAAWKAGIDVAVDASRTSGRSVDSALVERSFAPYFAAAFEVIGGP